MRFTLSWCWKTTECKKYHEWDPREGDQKLKRERDRPPHMILWGALYCCEDVCMCCQLTWLMKEGDVDDDEEEELIMNIRNEEDIHTYIPEKTKALLGSTYQPAWEGICCWFDYIYVILCSTRIEEVCPFEVNENDEVAAILIVRWLLRCTYIERRNLVCCCGVSIGIASLLFRIVVGIVLVVYLYVGRVVIVILLYREFRKVCTHTYHIVARSCVRVLESWRCSCPTHDRILL